jgi:hypothetical protein
LIDIASSFDFAEVEPEIRALQQEPFGTQEPVRTAIANFLAFRGLPVQTVVTKDEAKPGRRGA